MRPIHPSFAHLKKTDAEQFGPATQQASPYYTGIDLKMIEDYQTALSRGQTFLTPPVFLQNIGRSTG